MIGAEKPDYHLWPAWAAYFESAPVRPPPRPALRISWRGRCITRPRVLCELVASMHDAQGRVTLPGFYDKVIPLGA